MRPSLVSGTSGLLRPTEIASAAIARTDEIEQTVNADRSRLSYDADTGTYTYVWNTDKAWAGQCRRLTLRFADGIEHSALFRFR
jgi:hypothetical protein